MSEVSKRKIKYKPREIVKISPEYVSSSYVTPEEISSDTIALANKLARHLNTIKDYQNKLEAVNFLIDNADKLAKNLTFEADSPEIEAILKRKTGGTVMDFTVFKSAVDDTIKEWKRLALLSITGVSDADVIKKALNGE